MIRWSVNTAHSAHIHGYQHIIKYIQRWAIPKSTQLTTMSHSVHIHGYQHIIKYIQRWPILKYTQRTTMYAPTHNTKSTQRTATQCTATYIATYTCRAQSETIYTNDHLWLKSVASIITAAKQNLTNRQKSLSEIFHAMQYNVRTYSDTTHEK